MNPQHTVRSTQNLRDDVGSDRGVFSCVVDSHPRFHLEALRWFASLTRIVGADPKDLVVNVIGDRPSDVTHYLESCGVNVRAINPFDTVHPTATRLLERSTSQNTLLRVCASLTDTDVVLFEDPRSISVPADQVAIKLVDAPNPPLTVLEGVFNAAA